MAVPKEGSAKAKELVKSNAALTQRRQDAATKTASENARFASEQEKYDIEHNTQAGIAKQTGSGRFSQGGKITQLTPIEDPNFSKSRNAQGGYDYVVKLQDTAYFSDSVQTAKTQRQVYQVKDDYNSNQTARTQNISSDYTRHRDFLRSNQQDARAIIDYLEQRDPNLSRPTRASLEDYLKERDVVPSKEANEFIDFLVQSEDTERTNFVFFDPSTGKKFGASINDADLRAAEQVGFDVAPQPPSIPQNNNERVTLRNLNDVTKFKTNEVGYLAPYVPDPDPSEEFPASRITGIYQGDRFFFTPKKSREISAREKAELISRGDYPSGIVGKSDAIIRRQEEISASQQKFDAPQDITLPATYTDDQGRELFTIESQSDDSKFSYTIPAPKREPAPDPLNVNKGLQQGLDYLSDKAIQTRKLSEDPNQDFRTRAKATIENFQSEFGSAVLNIPASAVNLGAYAAQLQKGEQPSAQPINLPSESTEDIFFRRSFSEPDIATGLQNIPKNLQGAVQESVARKGVAGTAGSLAFSVANIAPIVIAAKPLVPLKIATLPVKSGIQGTTKEAKILVATIGEKTQPLVTKVTEKTTPIYTAQGKIAQAPKKVGTTIEKGFDITQTNLKKIGESYNVKEKGGAELAGLGRTEEKMLSSTKNLNKLAASGEIPQRQADRVIAVKQLVKDQARVPDRPFRKDFSDQPFENIAAGKETQVVKDFFREKGITLEGSGIDIPTFLPQYVSRAGDFDVKLASYAIAQDYSKDLAARLNKVTTGGRYFESKGGKLHVYEGGKLDKSRPVFENLQKGEYLHGSSESNIDNIINYGVDITKSKRGEGFFTTGRRNIAARFARRASRATDERTAYAKIKLNEGKVLDYASLSPKQQKQIYSDNWLTFQKNMIEFGKQRGALAVRKPYASDNPLMRRTETIILDEKIIKSVEPIAPTGYKVTGGKEVGKAGEFLAHDDPTAGGQISKTGKVFGVKTSQKTYKTEGIKRKGLQYQIGRRGASVTSIQRTGDFAPPINKAGEGTTRAKDLPRLYAGSKSGAEVLRNEGQTNLAKRIDANAEILKRTSTEIDFDEFFASRKPLTAAYAQAEKSSFEIGSNLGKITKQSSPVLSGGSSLAKSFGGYPTPKTNVSYSPASNVSNSNFASLQSKSIVSPSKSKSVVSKSNFTSMLSPIKSSTSKSGSPFSKPSSKSAYGSPSRYGSKTYYNLSKTGSPLSPAPKSLYALYPSKTKTSVPSRSTTPKILDIIPITKPNVPILRGTLPNKRSYPRKEKATQTLRWAVKNPFSAAFTIKEGKRGKRIEPF